MRSGGAWMQPAMNQAWDRTQDQSEVHDATASSFYAAVRDQHKEIVDAEERAEEAAAA